MWALFGSQHQDLGKIICESHSQRLRSFLEPFWALSIWALSLMRQEYEEWSQHLWNSILVFSHCWCKHPCIVFINTWLTQSHTSYEICCSTDRAFILDFLAALVEFKDVSKCAALEEIPKAFFDEYKHLEQEFSKPIPKEAHQVLDKYYLTEWTETYINHFQTKGFWNSDDWFFCKQWRGRGKPIQQSTIGVLGKVIMEVEVNCEVLLKCISTYQITDIIIKTMPVKLKTLKHGIWSCCFLAGYFSFTQYQTKSSSTLLENSLKASKAQSRK